MAFCSRERRRVQREYGDPARLVVKRRSPHDDTCAFIMRLPPPLFNRESVFRRICYSDARGLVLASQSVAGVVDYGNNFNTVRNPYTNFVRFEDGYREGKHYYRRIR